jgi:hypothetical protein
MQWPNWPPFAFVAIHVPVPPQSVFVSQMTYVDAHEAAHVLPAKSVTYEYEGSEPHAAWISSVPVPQHTAPPAEPTQSIGARHCQSVESAGHAVAVGSHVDVPIVGSQQCSPAAHL